MEHSPQGTAQQHSINQRRKVSTDKAQRTYPRCTATFPPGNIFDASILTSACSTVSTKSSSRQSWRRIPTSVWTVASVCGMVRMMNTNAASTSGGSGTQATSVVSALLLFRRDMDGRMTACKVGEWQPAHDLENGLVRRAEVRWRMAPEEYVGEMGDWLIEREGSGGWRVAQSDELLQVT